MEYKLLCTLNYQRGGRIERLKIPSELNNGSGLCNPSILIKNDKIFVNIRGVGYTLWHNENEQKYQNQWGVLAYIHPENDLKLRTTNFICELDKKTLQIIDCKKVETQFFDKEPLWEFIGLEDARLIDWNNQLKLSGVRRDTTTNGEGRMEISDLFNNFEVSRTRIEPPTFSYCEKNWMPVLDLPFHYVKWTNPTEVVRVDIETKQSNTICLVDQKIDVKRDLRGGSQVISYKGYYVAITHEVDLWHNVQGKKDGQYYHRFIVWNKDWEIVYHSDEFKFFGARIEFCCGLAHNNSNNTFLITFGFQDSTPFIMEMPCGFFEEFVGMNKMKSIKIKKHTNELTPFIDYPFGDIYNFNLGVQLLKEKHYSSALSFLLRTAEFSQNKDLIYESLLLTAFCLGVQGNREASERTTYMNAITILPNRPEAFYYLSKYYQSRPEEKHDAYAMACLSVERIGELKTFISNEIEPILEYSLLYQKAMTSFEVGLREQTREILWEIRAKYFDIISSEYYNLVQNYITSLGSQDKPFPKYTRQRYESLNFKFENIELIETNYSQVFQDMFVLYMLNGKMNGTYIELGASEPYHMNNTVLLEKTFNWKGISVEIKPEEVQKFREQRSNPVCLLDATKIEYDEFIESSNLGEIIDYLQVDCEPAMTTYQILKSIPFDKYKFRVITFEHDHYVDMTNNVRKLSREFLLEKGYELVVANVSPNDKCPFEDWWVHPELVSKERIEKIKNDLVDFTNIDEFFFSKELKKKPNKIYEKFNWGKLDKTQSNTIFREILNEKVYQKYNSVKENDVVVDIGSNAGLFTCSILDKKPKKVFCIEPSANLIQASKKNVETFCNYLKIENCVTHLEYAITENESENVRVFCPGKKLKKVTFSEFIQSNKINKIDFLKVDCEGGEYSIFNSENLNFIKENVKFMAIEIHLRDISGINNFRQKFIQLRDTFLLHFSDYYVLSDGYLHKPKSLHKYIFDNSFIENYSNEFMIYIMND